MKPATANEYGKRLFALLNEASADLINPDEVGHGFAEALAEAVPSDRLAFASYLSLLVNIADNAVGLSKVNAIEADHRAEQSLDADDKDAMKHHRNHRKATRSLIRLANATRKAAILAINHADDASHA